MLTYSVQDPMRSLYRDSVAVRRQTDTDVAFARGRPIKDALVVTEAVVSVV